MEMSPLASRLCALEALSRCLEAKDSLEAAVARAGEGLDGPSRAFALTLCRTTLKRLGQIDALLTAWMDSPLPPGASKARQVLRLGFAQILFMDIPAHAAVHTTVELMREVKLHGFAGLANALMQRAAREGLPAQDAELLNTPGWMWKSWVDAYGEADARAIARANLSEPPLDICVKSEPEMWASRLGAEVVEGATLRLTRPGAVTQLEGYDEGAWWVQDASAAVPARMLEDAMGSLKGKRVVDLCAAPGGKTAQLISMGAEVTAVDVSASRLRVLRENMKRLGYTPDIVECAGEKYSPEGLFDAVLLDAPCSATGTLKRHPDIAFHRQVADVERLVATQKRLLNHCIGIVKPGGFIAYAVCSMQPEEGYLQIVNFLSDNPQMRLYKEQRIYPQTPPQSGDGFYIALLTGRSHNE